MMRRPESIEHSTRQYPARGGRLGLLAAVAFVALVAGCASPAGPTAEADGEASGDGEAGTAGSSLCALTDDLAGDIELVSMDEIDDPGSFPARVAAAAERFDATEPPEGIDKEWTMVSQLFTLVDGALEGKEIGSEDDLREALSMEGEEAFFLVLAAPGSAEAIGVHLQQECGADLGFPEPALADACGAIDAAHLGSVFDGAAPEGERMRWAGGITECSWKDGDVEVALTVGPAKILHDDVLRDVTPIDTVNADPPVEVYDGALGPFRFASGRTAIGEVNETGVLVSIRAGDHQAEINTAVELVGLVAGEL